MAQRINRSVSVRPGLADRMQKFPNENWSAVACVAFELRLKELEKGCKSYKSKISQRQEFLILKLVENLGNLSLREFLLFFKAKL